MREDPFELNPQCAGRLTEMYSSRACKTIRYVPWKPWWQ